MNWRSIQLGSNLCDQDKIIIDLFKDRPVKYIGTDLEFKKNLNVNNAASNLILILNQPQWCSDVIKICRDCLDSTIDKFYIGVNRYQLLGNDTTRNIESSGQHGVDYIKFLTTIVTELGFCVTKTGSFDNDLGRYFNFVQPLTWIYGNNVTNKGK